MKEKMTRWFRYTAEDVKAAQAELDELAEQGWELAELGIFTASFRHAEQPRRCWGGPARWASIRRKDEQARTDYLALCEEAGWNLLDEAGGLFYFQAQPDTDSAPIQTDGSLEWEDVLKKKPVESGLHLFLSGDLLGGLGRRTFFPGSAPGVGDVFLQWGYAGSAPPAALAGG